MQVIAILPAQNQTQDQLILLSGWIALVFVSLSLVIKSISS